jgi:tight adherence protein C
MVNPEILIVGLIFICVSLTGIGVYLYTEQRRERRTLVKRIQRTGDAIDLEERNILEGMKRHWLGFFTSLGLLVKPKNDAESSGSRKEFLMAGYRGESAPVIFWAAKVLLAVFTAVIFISIRLLIAKPMPSLHLSLLTVLFALASFHLPNLWLRMKIAERKEKIRAGLPDALDLMVVCVVAGNGLDAAINRVAEEMELSNKPVSQEFKLLSLEMRAGKSRQDALRNLALRTDLEDVSSLVTLLIQTEKFGTSIAQALRIHSDSMRTKRFQSAEEVAAKLPVKLIFPLVLFILPSLFAVILGPAAITIFRTLLPGLRGGG